MKTEKLSFHYDGACPVCAAEVDRLRSWNKGSMAFVDISDPAFDPAACGATLPEMMARVHAFRPDGSALIGMDAIRAAYGEAGLGWLLAPTRWPLLRPLFDAFYGWFARNRYRFSARRA